MVTAQLGSLSSGKNDMCSFLLNRRRDFVDISQSDLFPWNQPEVVHSGSMKFALGPVDDANIDAMIDDLYEDDEEDENDEDEEEEETKSDERFSTLFSV